VKPWLLYAIVRIGLFLAAIGLMWLILGADWGTWWWLAITLAAVIAWTVSYLGFRRLRERVVEEFAERAARRTAADADAEIEDAAADRNA